MVEQTKDETLVTSDEKLTIPDDELTVVPQAEVAPVSKQNRRKEKMKDLLHDESKIKDLAKKRLENKPQKTFDGHYKQVGEDIINILEGLGKYYAFEFLLGVEEAKNYLSKINYLNGKEREQLITLIDLIQRHLQEMFRDHTIINRQLQAMDFHLNEQYPEKKGVFKSLINAPFKLAQVSTRTLTFGLIGGKDKREVK